VNFGGHSRFRDFMKTGENKVIAGTARLAEGFFEASQSLLSKPQ
jgi:hypothetical protein